jgi:hypothetical protein
MDKGTGFVQDQGMTIGFLAVLFSQENFGIVKFT